MIFCRLRRFAHAYWVRVGEAFAECFGARYRRKTRNMARTVRDSSLDSRAARARIAQRHKPYYRLIDQGCHLGYRKGPRGGSWSARYFVGVGKYAEKTLGIADDTQDADGKSVLSFAQAQQRARAWFSVQARLATGEGHIGPYTVADAWRDYLDWFGAHRKSLRAMQVSGEAHILPTLGPTELSAITSSKLRLWHEKLAATPARTRSKKGKPVRYRGISDDPEALRRRKATANRILSILKAALNHAWREGMAATDVSWRRVTPFHNVNAPRIRYLAKAECKRLVNACEPEFRKLIQAALLTGCRYGELTALCVWDFNPDSDTLRVQRSKSGKPRDVYVNAEGERFLRSVTAGRNGDEIMFLRGDKLPWGKAHQVRPLLEACKRAKISPAIGFHILRHTYASLLVMAGAPLQVVAQNLGHADTRMTERHYAHLASSYVADTIRALSPRLQSPFFSSALP
jgi:integrase